MKIYGNNSFYNFAIFGQIFVKFSPKCSLEQQIGNIKHHFRKILQFFELGTAWADILPQIWPRKILEFSTANIKLFQVVE